MDAVLYRQRVADARPIIYAAVDLLRAAERMVADDDGANEQASKRLAEAIVKAERSLEVMSK